MCTVHVNYTYVHSLLWTFLPHPADAGCVLEFIHPLGMDMCVTSYPWLKQFSLILVIMAYEVNNHSPVECCRERKALPLLFL